MESHASLSKMILDNLTIAGNGGGNDPVDGGNLPTATVTASRPLKSILLANRFEHWKPTGTGAGLSVNYNMPQYSEFTNRVANITTGMIGGAGLTVGAAAAIPALLAGGAELGAAYTELGIIANYAANIGRNRVFWSGGLGAKVAAENFARNSGGKTLEMTFKGKSLTFLTRITSPRFTHNLWNNASASFAKGAKGPVTVFQNANSGVRINSVWAKTEYPILKQANKITFKF